MFNVVHFEIPADDVERAQKFYGELFGWKIEKFAGPCPMDYWPITTGAEKGGMGPGRRDDEAANPPAADYHLY